MTKGKISVSFGGNTVEFDGFTDTDFPRTYMAQASLEFSQIGTAYASGPARKQRQMWSISSHGDSEKWDDIQAVYDSWDEQRARGSNLAYVSFVDELIGSAKTYKAFFTEPPALSKISPSNSRDFIITFVLVEI
jgi:hypothetical protein